ncbi:unnamed protein product [Orchesella dallaii]|uniref:Uncharacterized protein n=1 Tax=Orchesella dallaii TaxID=48710 RepID=A0ABP1QTL4_9HEXA
MHTKMDTEWTLGESQNLQLQQDFIPPPLQKNTFSIRQHMTNDVHIATMKHLYERSNAISEEEALLVKKRYDEQDRQLYIPTENMIRTVYAEVKAEVSFRKHPLFVELQKLHGVNLGIHHFARDSAVKICAVISDKMHTN